MRYKFLPQEFRVSHEFAFFLHDVLARTVVSGEEADVFRVRFALRSEDEIDTIASLKGEALWKWLDDNGYKRVTRELAYKQVLVALLADFCHFIYEAISCSAKCKVTVAYALLRKPLKDNLFYLEWLLADSDDFMDKFLVSSTSIAIPALGKIDDERKLEIIRAAMAKTRFPDWIPADFIYDLRYKKAAPYGFEPLWNKAMHLVTDYKAFQTEEMNFNFVFSGEEQHLDQWNHFYAFLPLLLYHAVEVVDALIDTIVDWDESAHELEIMRRMVGLVLWRDAVDEAVEEAPSLKLIQKAVGDLRIECPTCSKRIMFNKRNLRSFYKRSAVTCSNCHTRVILGKPDEEKLP